MIKESARAKAMQMLTDGVSYVEIERATGIKNVTSRSWNMKRLKGIKSLTSLRVSARHDSGALYEISGIEGGWAVGMALDLLRYKFTDFPNYFESKE